MTERYRPLILSTQQVTRFRPFATKTTPPRSGVALVVGSSNGHLRHLAGPPTHGDRAFGATTTHYEVDMGIRDARFTFALQSRSDAFSFQAETTLSYHVQAPAEVVRLGMNDGDRAVEQYLVATMQPYSRRYELTESRELEDQLRTVFSAPEPCWVASCLIVKDVAITIRTDAATQAWQREQLELTRATEKLQKTHVVDVERQRLEKELAELRAMAARATVEQETRHTSQMRALEQKFTLELEAQRLRADIERQRLESEAAIAREREQKTVIAEALTRGEVGLLEIHLTRHPDDLKEIVQHIIQADTVAEQRRTDLLQTMLEKKLIQTADLDGGVGADLLRAGMGISPGPRTPLFSLSRGSGDRITALSDQLPEHVIEGRTVRGGEHGPDGPTGTESKGA